ncbi:MAG: hypothetical protein ACI84K_001592 [Pseudohongiellaceae bacterium]|jgi:hypothetical protein
MTDPHPFGGPHTSVQAHNKGRIPKRESNHVPPKSVYEGSPYAGDVSEGKMPAHSILYTDHRVDKGAAGDGATGTGSSHVAKQYRLELKALMNAGKFAEAMAYDIRDLQNTHGIDFSYYNKGLGQTANYARETGLIDENGYILVINQIFGRG